MMKGFYNRILHVDVTGQTSRIEAVDDAVLERHLGGKGLCTYLLNRDNPPGVDPLSPENRLILGTGPIAGTSVWGCCRYGIFTKSPQTGRYAESYSGGTVADFMARTGFDAMVLNGASEGPVWLEISDDGVRVHDASDIWGRDAYETEDGVKAWIKENRQGVKNCGVICIGPAGENLVALSAVKNDYWRSAGRTGAGAVMGSKRIKAVAFHGSRKKEVADPDGLKAFAKAFAREGKDNAAVKAYKSMGTPMMVDIMSSVGSFPTRYWYKGEAEHKEKINAAALHDRLDVTPRACLHCFIACSRLSTVKEGRHAGLKIEGPEYETIYAFGGLCEVDSIEEIAYLNDVCDRLGMDTISAGNLAAFAIEASRLGKIEYDIDYGGTDRIAELLEDMAYRRGVGDTLANGIRAAARAWDMEDVAVHVKGLEPAGYDPRVLKGMGLAYG
ncbi:MAG: aldehyde:ferredoxin oxidoreductase, partial [Deltaproteobacteria bacterium]|nr:aldehyde:ferredoxin oxidoreductase [Deltaproteobacteria bacterium]